MTTTMNVKKMETALRRAEAGDTADSVFQQTVVRAIAYTTATTSHTPTTIKPANAVKAPAPPPAREPLAPHPLEGYLAALAIADGDSYEGAAAKTTTLLYAAHVARLIKAKKADASVAVARVHCRVEKLCKAVAVVDDGIASTVRSPLAANGGDASDSNNIQNGQNDEKNNTPSDHACGLASTADVGAVLTLQRQLPGLVLDTTSLGDAAYHAVLLFGRELTLASRYMSGLEARAAGLARGLVAREREVLLLREELAVARSQVQEPQDEKQEHDEKQEQEPEPEPVSEQEQKQKLKQDQEQQPEQNQDRLASGSPLSGSDLIQAVDDDGDEVGEDVYPEDAAVDELVRRSVALEEKLDALLKRSTCDRRQAMQQLIAREKRMAQARRELEEALGVREKSAREECDASAKVDDDSKQDNDVRLDNGDGNTADNVKMVQSQSKTDKDVVHTDQDHQQQQQQQEQQQQQQQQQSASEEAVEVSVPAPAPEPSVTILTSMTAGHSDDDENDLPSSQEVKVVAEECASSVSPRLPPSQRQDKCEPRGQDRQDHQDQGDLGAGESNVESEEGEGEGEEDLVKAGAEDEVPAETVAATTTTMRATISSIVDSLDAKAIEAASMPMVSLPAQANAPQVSRLVTPKIHVRQAARLTAVVSTPSSVRHLLAPGWALPRVSVAPPQRGVAPPSSTAPISVLVPTSATASATATAPASATAPTTVRAPTASRLHTNASGSKQKPKVVKVNTKPAQRPWR